jgi:hypothetical protein
MVVGTVDPNNCRMDTAALSTQRFDACCRDEMLSLQYTMAMAAWTIRSRRANAGDGFLDELIPICKKYHGPDRDEKSIEAIKKFTGFPEEARAALDRAMRNPNAVWSKYSS